MTFFERDVSPFILNLQVICTRKVIFFLILQESHTNTDMKASQVKILKVGESSQMHVSSII